MKDGRRFRGPVWPMCGPDEGEPLEQFDTDFLRHHCRSVRVSDYLRRLDAEREFIEEGTRSRLLGRQRPEPADRLDERRGEAKRRRSRQSPRAHVPGYMP